MRERRGSYNWRVVGFIPSFRWIIKRKDLVISLVDVAHTRMKHVYLCLYCIVYLLCFISAFVFILLLCDIVFLTKCRLTYASSIMSPHALHDV
jgi:hypothetical protein